MIGANSNFMFFRSEKSEVWVRLPANDVLKKKSVGSSVGRAKVMYYIFLYKKNTAIWIFWEL